MNDSFDFAYNKKCLKILNFRKIHLKEILKCDTTIFITLYFSNLEVFCLNSLINKIFSKI